MSRLEGKRCVVTGAGQGLGAAIVELFAAEGAEVFAWSRTESTLMDRFEGVAGVTPVACDVTDADAVARAAERSGQVYGLVNNAGLVATGGVLATDDAAFAESLEHNVASAHRVTRALLPGMIASGGGSIVMMSSVLSSIAGVPDRYAYGAAKAALIGMTKSIAVDLAEKNVRCNAVCPGAIDTPGMRERLAGAPDPEKATAAMIARHPVGRMADPLEIAEMCLYLVSDMGGFASGQAFVLDGGMTA